MNLVKLRVPADLSRLFSDDLDIHRSPVADLLRTGDPLVIDTSLEPINLVRYERHQDFPVPIASMLSEICTHVGVPFSNVHWISPIPEYQFANKHLFNGTYEEYLNSRTNPVKFSLNVSKCFLSLNNYPREHRKQVVNFIEHNGIGNNCYYSYNPREIEGERSIKIDDQFSKIDSTLDGLDMLGKEVWESTLVSIVTETLFVEDLFFPTEKTWKVFDKYHMPIFVSTHRFVEQVRDLGFDVFDDYIDHSYDTINDSNQRLACALDEVLRWSAIDINKLNKIKLEVKDRMQSNQCILNHLISSDISRRDIFLNSFV